MKLGIFAKTFAGIDPATVLKAAKSAGFQTVQYNMACSGLGAMPDAIAPEVLTAIKAASAEVEIAAVSGTYNMIHPHLLAKAFGLARLQVLAKACAGMGTKVITLCTGTRDIEDQWRHHADNNTPEAWAELCTEMAKALKIAEKHKVILAIEPELANVVNSAEKARQLLDEMQSDNLKIVFDAVNLFETCSGDEQRRIIASSLDLLGDDIVMAHAKDRDASGAFATAGKGVLDYDFYIHCLKAIDFQGPLVTHGLTAAEAPQVAQFLKEKLSA
jgi:sugar phosphate isomerase/epimerase